MIRGKLHVVEWPPEQVQAYDGSFYVFRDLTIVSGPFMHRRNAEAWIDKLQPKGDRR